MRLTSVYVEAFWGIPRLELGLDPVTVVIGENNHGRTSLFDVLGLCLALKELTPESRFREDDFFHHWTASSAGRFSTRTGCPSSRGRTPRCSTG